jgi:hypothetical protein
MEGGESEVERNGLRVECADGDASGKAQHGNQQSDEAHVSAPGRDR